MPRSPQWASCTADRHDAASDSTEPRETSGATTNLLLRYVRELGGDQAVAETLALADVPHTVQSLQDTSLWVSCDTRLRLFEAATTVLKNPRTAAKKRGRNQVALASEAPRTAPAPSLQAELRTGVACGELRLHFQSVVDVSVAGERTVVAAEALVRWQHPRLGLLALRAAADG